VPPPPQKAKRTAETEKKLPIISNQQSPAKVLVHPIDEECGKKSDLHIIVPSLKQFISH
jgi:hypothetical protein